MRIEIHQFKASIKLLTESGLSQLFTILGVPREFWTENQDYKTKDLFALEYSLGSDTQSLYLKLGKFEKRTCIDPETGEVADCEENYTAPGFERYYLNASLLLHGKWFDNAPNFDFGRLLSCLDNMGYTPTELDVAYVDDTEKTQLSDWLESFEKWEGCITGNTVRRQIITTVQESGKFLRAQIGAATSKTAYGTFYQRPNGDLRLELKYRKPAHIRQLLNQYDESDRAAFHRTALDVLVSSLDIVTPETKGTRKQIRVKFYADFLGSTPKRVKRSTAKARKTLTEEQEAYTKQIAARFQNAAKRFMTTPQEILEDVRRKLLAACPTT